MGEGALWQLFLDEHVQDLQYVLLHEGVNGLLAEFEMWLYSREYLTVERALEARSNWLKKD